MAYLSSPLAISPVCHVSPHPEEVLWFYLAELARRTELAALRVVCFEEPVYLAYVDGLAAQS
jgi:hypothetical protein